MTARTSSRKLTLLIIAVATIEGLLIAVLAFAFVMKAIPVSGFIAGVVVLSALAMPVIVLTAAKLQQVKQAELNTSLSDAGFNPIDIKTPSERKRAFEPFAHVKELRGGARRVTLAGETEISGKRVVVIRHDHMNREGTTSKTLTHTCAAVRVPTAWPGVRLSGEHLGHKIAGWFGAASDEKLESEAFNRAWHVDAGESARDFAVLLLTPELQDWLTPREKHESWFVESGWLICIQARRIKPEELQAFAERPVEFLQRVPAELDAYV